MESTQNGIEKNVHINSHLQKSWNKYGEENFEFTIIEECDDELQYEVERQYLDLYKPFNNNGYNICKCASGGGNISGKMFIYQNLKKKTYTKQRNLYLKV